MSRLLFTLALVMLAVFVVLAYRGRWHWMGLPESDRTRRLHRGAAAGALLVITALVAAFATKIVGSVWDLPRRNDDAPIGAFIEGEMPYSSIFDGIVVPLPIERLPAPPRTTSIGGYRDRCGTLKWARALGGVQPETAFAVYLEGLAERTVTLDKVDVDVSKRQPPMIGTRLDCLAGVRMAGRDLTVDLDAEPAKVKYQVPSSQMYRIRTYKDHATGRKRRVRILDPAVSVDRRGKPLFLFTLRRGDVEVFMVYAFPQHCWCTWRIRFHYVSAGRRGTLTVPDESDPPLQTTPSFRATQAEWDAKRGWIKQRPPR